MAKRKNEDIGKPQFNPGAPHNQPFNVSPRRSVKKRSWWAGYSTRQTGGGTSN